jgi:uncharacterized Tic20 family protein
MTDHQPAAAVPPLSPADEQLWSTLAHVGNVIGFLPSLLILLILGPRSPKVKQESQEALNFVITAIIALVALAIVSAIVGTIAAAAPDGIGLLFGLLTLLIGLVQFAVYVLVIALSIVAAVRVNNGGSYRYPFSLRLIKQPKGQT